MVIEGLFGVVENLVTFVLQVNEILSLGIFFLVGFSFLDHIIDLRLGETTGRLDNDVLSLTGTLILGSNVDQTRLIDIEDNFDLRNTLRGRGDISKIELTEELVLSNHGSFTLEDSDGDDGLVVGSSGENLRLLGGDGGISFDHLGHDTTVSFNTQSKGGNVEKDDILESTTEDGTLDGSTASDGFIGVDGFVGLLVEEVGDDLLDHGDTGRTTDQENFVDLILGETGVL